MNILKALVPSRFFRFQTILLIAVALPAETWAAEVLGWGTGFMGLINPPEHATNVISITGGDYHAVALRKDGTAVHWGMNVYSAPAFEASATNLAAIAAGSIHTLSLTKDGVIQPWGSMFGRPNVPPAAATNIVAIAKGAGAQQGLALRKDGALFNWGNNPPELLAPPPEATNIVSMSVGAYHSVAVRADGRVIAWGDNTQGQLNVPAFATKVVAVSSGWYHSSALKADGTVITWGSTFFVGGSLQPPAGLKAVEIASGGNHVLALTQDGSVVAWGNNDSGKTTVPSKAVRVAAIGAGSHNSYAVLSSNAPVFATPALDRRVASGETAFFRMFAVGAPPLHYQWSCNGTNVPGATNSILAVPSASIAQTGDSYVVTVTNALGNTISSPMKLYVEPVQVTVNPSSSIVLRQQSFTLESTVFGTGPVTYQWQFNGTNLAPQTAASLTIGSAEVHQTGVYSCAVSNQFGGAIASAYVTVVPILITNQPSSQVVTAGTNTVLSVNATGVEPIDYQWQFQGTNLPGATGSSLALLNVQTNQSGDYRCVLINPYGTVTSAEAILTVVPVRITSHPVSRSVPAGTNVTFTVNATGEAPFTYQWQKNGTNLPGAIESSLTIENVQLAHAGSYACLVDNQYGTVTSSQAALTVSPLLISSQPVNTLVAIGGTAQFSLAVMSVAPPAYQWRLNGTNLSGATNALLSITNAQSHHAGAYSCIVSNAYGLVTSSNATLTVAPLYLTLNPTSRTVNGGANTTFSTSVTGAAPITYQWRLNGTNIANATSASLNLVNIQLNQDGWYSVIASNAFGSIESDPAKLTVVPLTVLTQPMNRTVLAGTPTSASVSVTGKSPFTYRWLLNGTNVPGAVSAMLTIPVVQVSHSGLYEVVVSNSFGAVTAPILALEVTPLRISSQPTSRSVLAGSNTTFSVFASGQNPITFQWIRNGAVIPNATNQLLELTNVPLSAAGNYQAVVSNPYLTITSSVAVLTVETLQVIAPLPNKVIFRGGTFEFAPTILSSEPLDLQWRFNGLAIPDATNATLVISNIQYSQAGTYSVEADNSLVQTNISGTVAVVPAAVWGDSADGQIYVPASLSNVVAIAAGAHHTLALRSDGTVTGWGQSWNGQINIPAGLSNVVAIAAGLSHSVALHANGTITTWGNNSYGQCNVPPGLSNVVQVSSKELHTLALTSDGLVHAWGENGSGQTNVPADLNNVVAVAAGMSHNLALLSDGTVRAWGNNNYGQCSTPLGLSNVIAISAGAGDSLALQSNGVVVAWGANSYGTTNLPPGLDRVTAIAAGYVHNLALRDDGTVIGWGYDVHLETQPPSGLSNVVAIAAGHYHSAALIGDKPSLHVALALAQDPQRTAAGFSLTVPSLSGSVYRLESSTSLMSGDWMPLPLAAGNGGTLTLNDPSATNSVQFYRVRKW